MKETSSYGGAIPCATTAAKLTTALGAEVVDPEEETFLLFATAAAAADLGFVDARANAVCVAVGGRDVAVRQSPGLLTSSRAGGTTGAVLWKITPLVAAWLAAPSNPLVGLLARDDGPRRPAVLELGCGVSALNALALRPRAGLYVLSDQPYVQRLLAQNMAAAMGDDAGDEAAARSHHHHRPRRRICSRSPPTDDARAAGCHVCFRPLDWEADVVTASLASPRRAFDAVLACDCVFNEALVAPLVQTCVDACTLRQPHAAAASQPTRSRNNRRGHLSPDDDDDDVGDPCLCIIAQQLRSSLVFETWLTAFHAAFRVWRIPDTLLPADLYSSAGFVVHVGILRTASNSA